MSCNIINPIFASPEHIGIKIVSSEGDGRSISLECKQAYSPNENFEVAYNIYFSNKKENVFNEEPKYVTVDTVVKISQFSPHEHIYFGIRAMLWDPSDMDVFSLPSANELAEVCYIYPETILTQNLLSNQTEIYVLDATDFPIYGVIVIDKEAIVYNNVDYNNNILYTTPIGRGRYGTTSSNHIAEDGNIVKFFKGYEESNLGILKTEAEFHKPFFAYTEEDGYRQIVKDIINTDLAAPDQSNADFEPYPYTGYHTTNIIDYFSGKCIGSYHGGSYTCGDGYGKYKTKVRGVNIQKINIQRQQMLLNVTGEPIVLLKRKWTGIKCNCVRANYEVPQGRCPICLGVGFVGGYEQFYNPKRSDGRLLVRFDPTTDDVLYKNRGLEQNFLPNAWTVVTPGVKDRDVLIRFYEDGEEEFRYEILNVTRNKLLFSLSGAQKFQLHRIDKTDIIYQWRAFRNTAKFPEKVLTTLSTMQGYTPHAHEIVINEKTLSLSQINQTTAVSQGHSHPIYNGIVQEVLGHTHEIILL